MPSAILPAGEDNQTAGGRMSKALSGYRRRCHKAGRFTREMRPPPSCSRHGPDAHIVLPGDSGHN